MHFKIAQEKILTDKHGYDEAAMCNYYFFDLFRVSKKTLKSFSCLESA